MDKPDRVFLGPPVKRLPDGGAVFHAGDAYLLATPERELASELVEALREVVKTAEDQESGRRYSDSTGGWEMAMDDIVLCARAVLDKLEGKG